MLHHYTINVNSREFTYRGYYVSVQEFYSNLYGASQGHPDFFNVICSPTYIDSNLSPEQLAQKYKFFSIENCFLNLHTLDWAVEKAKEKLNKML